MITDVSLLVSGWFLSSLGNDKIPMWNKVLVMTEQLTGTASLRGSFSMSCLDNHNKKTKGLSYRHTSKNYRFST